MRLTRETLLRIARETAVKCSLSNPNLIAVYLTGSLRSGSPFLGGSADIDLVCVQDGQPRVRREILAVTSEVHLDILHRSRSDYEKPKELRLQPWLGPELYDALPLYTSRHFFEFLQAGVRDRYQDPASVLARSRTPLDQARQAWSKLQAVENCGPEALLSYLEAVELTAQSLALLNGAPLAERRLLLEFPLRSAAAGVPNIAVGLPGLLGAQQVDQEGLRAFLPDWESSFRAASERPQVDARLALPRLRYYLDSFTALLETETPLAILWPLLHTWTLACTRLPAGRQSRWRAACDSIGLSGPAFTERLDGLDHFIDRVEEVLESLALNQGLESG